MDFIRLCALTVSDPTSTPSDEHLEADAENVLRHAEAQFDQAMGNILGPGRLDELRDAVMCLVNAHRDLAIQQGMQSGAQLMLELLGKCPAKMKGE